jgi:hypothetical protein
LNECSKFGDKNIINGEIKFDYADTCRNDEAKCGKEGRYFEEESNIDMKVLRHSISRKLPYIGLIAASITAILLPVLLSR